MRGLSLLAAAVCNALLVSAACPYMEAGGADESLRKRQASEKPRVEGDDGFLDQFYVDDTDVYTTTDFGTPVDDRHSLKAGQRGPTLLEDFVLRTKITRFDHERIPERAVHARGAAAHGYFESYADWSNITAASFMSKAGKKTPIFLRFSTVAGSRGSADTARDVHGFALRFFTDAGNYDIVGNNIPVFFIQDAIQFPDLIHAVKPRPDNEIPQAATAHDTAWDFFSNNPSTMHTLMWAMSGHGIPRSFRHMDGFGVHTFRFVTGDGKSKLIKWHFKTKQGLASMIWEEAQTIAGQNADFHRQDLFDSIEAGNYPEWEVAVQIMNEEDVLKFGIDLLDPTKIVPVELVPLTPVGKFVLNRNTKNYFAETEQSMYSPGHVVRGIDFSDDPLLQGRLFSYVDTQLNRNMGSPNFEQIPINRPRNGVHNNNRDGAGQQMIPLNKAAYSENTLNNGSPYAANLTTGNGFITAPARRVVDAHYVREISPTFLDYWTQPRLLLNSLLPAEQQMVVNAMRFELSKITSTAVRARTIGQLNRISNDIATRVAVALGMPAPSPDPKYYHNNKTEGVSVFSKPLPNIQSLNIGILVTAANKESVVQAGRIAALFKAKKANAIVVGEHLTDGVQQTYSATNAALLDAVIAVGKGTEQLFVKSAKSSLYPPGRPVEIFRQAYWFGKPVGVVGWADAKNSGVENGGDGFYALKDATAGLEGFVDSVEKGLKTFKFLGRFAMDAPAK